MDSVVCPLINCDKIRNAFNWDQFRLVIVLKRVGEGILWVCFCLRSVNTKIPQLEAKFYPCSIHWDYHEYKWGVTCVRVLNDLKDLSLVYLTRIIAF